MTPRERFRIWWDGCTTEWEIEWEWAASMEGMDDLDDPYELDYYGYYSNPGAF